MKADDFKYEINNKIVNALYEELEKENGNISIVLDRIEDEAEKNHLTAIMAEDYGITDNKKAIEEILNKYEREKLERKRDEIIAKSNLEQNETEKKQLEKELNHIILKLAKIK